MGSYTDRDGLAVITDNVWGPDGYPLDVDGNPIYFVDENGDTVSSGKDIAVYNYAGVGSDPFRTSSLIINAWSGKDGTPFDYSTGSALDTSGTGKGASDSESADMTFAEGAYDPDNLEIRQMNLSRAGFSVMNFNARLCSKMYDQLAKLTIPGYQAMYDDPTELDKSALEAPIAAAQAKLAEFGKYTDDTVASLTEAYEQALSLWNNTTFSSEQNTLVTAAAAQLDTALAGLKAKSQSGEKADPSSSAKGTASSEGSGAQGSAGKGKTSDAASVLAVSAASANTGSDVAVTVAVMLLLLGAGTTAGVYARRKGTGR